ncbi:ammonium transporter [Candidatus Contubernalis alkaliaceticus]|uniref:ammonium transporter n=1 Tax=Candidatus Contubernalis alkaliaceticus TaxID=338645 RepID=UPI001F4BED22|nr:ammonium transporter [Candidatus Contubernalis alkalaceticus]UNC91910.1 ammonium transporter [Candidatus Contubernalis alkalaceticus]
MDQIMIIDTVWVLLAAFLVFLMQVGFAMVEIGFTRAKNSLNILMKNVIDVCTGAVVYFMVGFGIMFGDSIGGFIGSNGFFLSGAQGFDFGVPTLAFWVFQAVFAATAATIVSGAVAERMKFSAYILSTILMTALVYPIVGHWVWGDGWLGELGFLDFAGSTVVHSVGAFAAMVGAYMVGPRTGKYTGKQVNAIPGHNIPLGGFGVFILWFGWFGFNGGSTIAASDPGLISSIIVVTLLGGAAGAVGAMIFTWIRYGKPDPSLILNGILAGLVGITAGADVFNPVGAMIVGFCASIVMILAVELFDKVIRIDDPVGAISVHGAAGAFGTICVGLFAVGEGLFYGGGVSLLIAQVIGVAAVFAWTVVVVGTGYFIISKIVGGIRVTPEEEKEGLDIGEHGMRAYNIVVGNKAS